MEGSLLTFRTDSRENEVGVFSVSILKFTVLFNLGQQPKIAISNL